MKLQASLLEKIERHTGFIALVVRVILWIAFIGVCLAMLVFVLAAVAQFQ